MGFLWESCGSAVPSKWWVRPPPPALNGSLVVKYRVVIGLKSNAVENWWLVAVVLAPAWLAALAWGLIVTWARLRPPSRVHATKGDLDDLAARFKVIEGEWEDVYGRMLRMTRSLRASARAAAGTAGDEGNSGGNTTPLTRAEIVHRYHQKARGA